MSDRSVQTDENLLASHINTRVSVDLLSYVTRRFAILASKLETKTFKPTRKKTMLDGFSKVVAQADAQGQYISPAQLDALSAMVAEGNKRMDTVNRITSNSSTIVANAARALFAEQPNLIAPGGNAYTSRRMAACLRDMEIILRYVTYAIFAGDASVLDDRCLNGLRETYLALGTPGSSVATGVQKMKDAALAIVGDRNNITNGDCSSIMSEVASYFDRAAAAVG
jgi:phycocyanin beta chain